MSRWLLGICTLLAWPAFGCSEAMLDAVGLPPAEPGADLSEGLVAHWPLDDGSGTVALDQSGNERHGQVAGGTWISDGQFAGGLLFAAGDSVTVANVPHAAPNFTLSVWIRLSAEQFALDGEAWVAILSTENFRAGGWQLNINNRIEGSYLHFAYWAPPLQDFLVVECSCIETGRWIHLAVVVDVEENRVTLYRDGSITDAETRPTDIPPGDSTLYFARWNDDGRLWTGDLDDVAIWNRALSANEIAALRTRSP